MKDCLSAGEKGDTVFDNLIEGFQLIGFDWRYLYVNKAAVKQSKCVSKEDLLGYTMMEKYPGIENTKLFGVLERCMKKRISQNFENEFTFPDHSKSWFELRIQPVTQGIFILSLDITDRKKAEREKKEYIEGLEEMIFITSHKVRQPVSHILGVSDIIESSIHSPGELNTMVNYIKQSALSLDTFTKELTIFINDMKVKVKD